MKKPKIKMGIAVKTAKPKLGHTMAHQPEPSFIPVTVQFSGEEHTRLTKAAQERGERIEDFIGRATASRVAVTIHDVPAPRKGK